MGRRRRLGDSARSLTDRKLAPCERPSVKSSCLRRTGVRLTATRCQSIGASRCPSGGVVSRAAWQHICGCEHVSGLWGSSPFSLPRGAARRTGMNRSRLGGRSQKKALRRPRQQPHPQLMPLRRAMTFPMSRASLDPGRLTTVSPHRYSASSGSTGRRTATSSASCGMAQRPAGPSSRRSQPTSRPTVEHWKHCCRKARPSMWSRSTIPTQRSRPSSLPSGAPKACRASASGRYGIGCRSTSSTRRTPRSNGSPTPCPLT